MPMPILYPHHIVPGVRAMYRECWSNLYGIPSLRQRSPFLSNIPNIYLEHVLSMIPGVRGRVPVHPSFSYWVTNMDSDPCHKVSSRMSLTSYLEQWRIKIFLTRCTNLMIMLYHLCMCWHLGECMCWHLGECMFWHLGEWFTSVWNECSTKSCCQHESVLDISG